MAEEIPLDPFEPHTEEHEGEEETSFGGRDNDGFDPDDYSTDEARRNARAIIDTLRENGLPAPTDLLYAFRDNEVLVSADRSSWYKLVFGAGRDGEEVIGVIPIGSAPDPPEELKIKLGLEADTDETTPLIGGKAGLMMQAIEEVRSKWPNLNLALLRINIDQNGRVVVSGRYGNKWTKEAPLYNSSGEVDKNLPKSVRDALGKSATEILNENYEELDKNSDKGGAIRNEEVNLMKSREAYLLNKIGRLENEKEELKGRLREEAKSEEEVRNLSDRLAGLEQSNNNNNNKKKL